MSGLAVVVALLAVVALWFVYCGVAYYRAEWFAERASPPQTCPGCGAELASMSWPPGYETIYCPECPEADGGGRCPNCGNVDLDDQGGRYVCWECGCAFDGQEVGEDE